MTFEGNTTYSLLVGLGGLGGSLASNYPIQSSGGNSYFKNGSVTYTAGGGTVLPATSSPNTGFQNSSGGMAYVSPAGSSTPTGFTGGGGGGGGGQWNLGKSLAGGNTGGTGGSYYSANAGVTGNTSFYSNPSGGVYSYYGGTGGSSYFTTTSSGVSTPFNSNVITQVGGGGGAATATSGSIYYSGYAGLGYGGAQGSNGAAYGWANNANNNSYSQYTLSGGSSTIAGPTGLQGGYGAGGGGGYPSGNTGGFGGNGTVIIWWDNNTQ